MTLGDRIAVLDKGRLWTAKVGQHADLAIGRPVRLALDLHAAYFFDLESGAAIARELPGTSVKGAGLKSLATGAFDGATGNASHRP